MKKTPSFFPIIAIFLTSIYKDKLTNLTLRTVKDPSFMPSARWMPSVLTAAQRMGSSMLQRAISA